MIKPLMILRDGKETQIIYEDGTAETDTRKPLAILEEKCLRNGSSAEGRMESFRYLLNIRQKAAVLISSITDEIWFPTLSMKQSDCVWIRYDAILQVSSKGPHDCEILFFSGLRKTLDCDMRVIREQMKRCRRYLELLHRD